MLDLMEQFKKEVTGRVTPERSRRPAQISLLQDFVKLILLVSYSQCDFLMSKYCNFILSTLEYSFKVWRPSQHPSYLTLSCWFD